jgi:hypothetical protein
MSHLQGPEVGPVKMRTVFIYFIFCTSIKGKRVGYRISHKCLIVELSINSRSNIAHIKR